MDGISDMSPGDGPGPSRFKDVDRPHPVAAAWRPLLRDIVRCFAHGDYALSAGISGVEPISAGIAEQIRAYITEYGARLTELPEAAWQSSVSQWYDPHWEVLVDLWTVEEGPSDLVLKARVRETDSGDRITVEMVYVP
ncbi:DUF7668 domain-containing protein [Roseateles amylovorans]|uniref:DUF7668 domain-containing protein n=1 Tax=Roseateles amylovorans TaxID=2978473 RepID=A0ABY6AXL0_9BURK|nr:hypothetical protein [Roseateles amylovorans]UXH76489.1 hypothetical protein N4261_15700 [Roseateles amylovorans]